MIKERYKVLGIMSGTSLDGIDIACLAFNIVDSNWQFEIKECETFAYPKIWEEKLRNAFQLSISEIHELDEEYTNLLGGIIKDFIHKYKIINIDAVCSHGHTILHQPEKGITIQIGNLNKLAKDIQITTVCNFRVQDVALGGQGAPLVPIGDRLLFYEYNYCLNLGGFSNISFEENGKRIAYDISAVNTVLNYFSNLLHLDYDNKGLIARSGRICHNLLNELNALQYYQTKPPKSLGIEYVHTILLPLLEKYPIPIEDTMGTFCEHIALQISKAIPIKEGSLLITGGGAFNEFLIERIQNYLPKTKIIIPKKEIINYKEALIFGFLGVLKLRGEINTLSSVTGANCDHSAGFISLGNL